MADAHPSSAVAYVGCAGWNVPRELADQFPATGTHLARYAQVYSAVEINSSFYRPHQPATYARWRDSVPPDFRFAVKMPKAISHTARLKLTDNVLEEFLQQTGELRDRLGCYLLQLPPSLRYDDEMAKKFFDHLRSHTDIPVALEPRHASWLTEPAEELLRQHQIARVAADPPRLSGDRDPGGTNDWAYFRWHGSPRMYYSTYSDEQLTVLAEEIDVWLRAKKTVWCIFDNTAAGAAQPNALKLLAELADVRHR